MKKTQKNNSAMRKLIPATSMLLVSGIMLASSTYAWFTMSREVEVKNIQMTASVPEDLQISLGKLTNIHTSGSGNPTAAEISTGSTYVGLQGNQGILLSGSDNGGATAPDNDGSAVDNLFWANTVDISEYYRMGKIIPASSTNGGDVFFTPDASGVGKTLKDGAKFYQVAALNSADFTDAHLYAWDTADKTFKANGTGGDKARTTLHAVNNVTRANDGWNSGAVEDGSTNNYDSADSWYDTNDDGYYVDIPMWIRSSAKDNTSLSIDAYVTTNAGKTDDGSADADDELYLAARTAIIYANDVTTAAKATTVNTSSNLLRIRKDSYTSTTSINDYMYTTNNANDAVASVSGTTPTYGAASEYDGDDIIAIPGRDEATTAKYGNMVKIVVRVWLEGEDPNCWNPNAGQDFNISLKFVKGEIKLGTEENASGFAYPAAYSAAGHANTDISADTGMVVTITETINGVADTQIKFTYDKNSDKWNQTTGSVEILNGKTYTISNGTAADDATVTGADGIADWLKAKVLTKEDLSKTYTITAS